MIRGSRRIKKSYFVVGEIVNSESELVNTLTKVVNSQSNFTASWAEVYLCTLKNPATRRSVMVKFVGKFIDPFKTRPF